MSEQPEQPEQTEPEQTEPEQTEPEQPPTSTTVRRFGVYDEDLQRFVSRPVSKVKAKAIAKAGPADHRLVIREV